MEVVVTSF